MLELLSQFTLEEPGDDVLDELLVGLDIEAKLVRVLGGDTGEALLRWVLSGNGCIGVHVLAICHLLLATDAVFVKSLDLDGIRYFRDLLNFRSFSGRFGRRTSCLGLLDKWWNLFFIKWFDLLAHVFLDLLGAWVGLGVVHIVRKTCKVYVFETKMVKEVGQEFARHLGGLPVLGLETSKPGLELLVHELGLGFAQWFSEELAFGARKSFWHVKKLV